MLDIHTAPTEAPPLTAHMRAHLRTQYRLDLRRDERELERLCKRGTKTDRAAALRQRCDTTRLAIAELDGRA